MAKPTSFRRAAGPSAFRTPLGRPYWRDTDRIRGGASESFRKGTGGGKKSGNGGGANVRPLPAARLRRHPAAGVRSRRPAPSAPRDPAHGPRRGPIPPRRAYRGRVATRVARAGRKRPRVDDRDVRPVPGRHRHRPPPACRHLRIATLCFSKRNAAELLSLLDARPGMALTLLVSSFFRDHNKGLFETFADDLKAHQDARLAAARSHCKVVCFDVSADDALVFEGSANLRTNKNREQLAVFRDRALHDWHAGWIDEMVDQHAGRTGQA
jgi:hypothetical protein